MSDFLPTRESELVTFADRFAGVIEKDPTVYRLSDEEVVALKSAVTEWDSDYAADVAARDAARAARQAKQMAREDVTELIRNVARRIQADSSISNAARAELGLPIHKTSRTPVSVPTSAPVGRIEVEGPLQHRLIFSGETHRGKPAGVMACRVLVAVGDKAPENPSDYRFVTQTGRSPYRVTFDETDSCKLAHYVLQWVNTREELGPMSSPITATVPAL